MTSFICPVCGKALNRAETCYRCENGHSFDIARQGYVNPLRSQQSSKKHHGDDKLMVAARRRFLDGGYYSPLRDKVCGLAAKYCPKEASVLDAGCGEGWYTSLILETLENAGKHVDMTGIDISKDALKAAGVRCRELRFAVASAFDLPVGDASQDMVISIFAPLAESEFRRVLNENGIFIRVVPDERHLFELKAAIYEKPYLNDPVETGLSGFDLIEDAAVSYTLHLSNTSDIVSLFMMTPYYYKTGAEDQKKVMRLDSLDTGACFRVLVYRKK